MTAALIVLAVTCITLACTMLLLVRMQAAERRVLVDRVVARHAGEAIALDRGAKPTVKPGPLDNNERPVAVGL